MFAPVLIIMLAISCHTLYKQWRYRVLDHDPVKRGHK